MTAGPHGGNRLRNWARALSSIWVSAYSERHSMPKGAGECFRNQVGLLMVQPLHRTSMGDQANYRIEFSYLKESILIPPRISWRNHGLWRTRAWISLLLTRPTNDQQSGPGIWYDMLHCLFADTDANSYDLAVAVSTLSPTCKSRPAYCFSLTLPPIKARPRRAIGRPIFA